MIVKRKRWFSNVKRKKFKTETTKLPKIDPKDRSFKMYISSMDVLKGL